MPTENNYSKRSGRPFQHIPVRSYDEDSRIFFLQSESKESRLGVCFQGRPMTGADDGTMDRLKSVLTMTMPAGTFVQFGLFSEPDIGSSIDAYLDGKRETTNLLKRLTKSRAAFIGSGG